MDTPKSTFWKKLRRVLALSLPYRRRVVVSIFIALASVAASLALPLGLRELLDTVLHRADRRLLNLLAFGLLSLLVVRGALSFFGGYLLRITGERIVADLRLRIYTHLHGLGLSFFTNQRIGDITSRLTSDVALVRTAASESVVTCLFQAARFCGCVTLILILNWRLGALVLIIMPTATLVSRWVGRRLQELARQMQDRLAETTAVASEALTGVRLVKAFAREPHEIGRYRTAVEAVFESSRRAGFVSTLFGSIIELLFSTSTITIFWYGGLQVLSGNLTAGDLIAFLFYAQQISQSVSEMAQLYATFNTAVGASERIFELLDTESDIKDAPDAMPLATARGGVCFESVWFGYGNSPVLCDINFSVRPGETVALVGPSGAGKTTLLSLMPRFYDVVSGRVLIDGHDVRSLRLSSLREQIAVVTQEVELFSASVRENIRYGRLDATDEEIEAAARAANAHDFINELPKGYDTQVGERGVKLSGGQRQRLAIARAFLKDAKILLLDEATSSVDAVSEALIQEAMEKLVRERTTFIIAHRFATVWNADRILVLEGGAIIEDGTHDELMAREGVYCALAAHQFYEVPDRLAGKVTPGVLTEKLPAVLD
ncbi:MAG: ATP-binding cassette, subfamily bacterial MsbA [Acidobacteriota bacterium]|jgi:subfamily B ATP-binding cassette protein MsbA|nr:ATP-binding cassette, subfamily bacterial MsbA [Acidobacteriota bacterium]